MSVCLARRVVTHTHGHTHTHDVKTITPVADVGCKNILKGYEIVIYFSATTIRRFSADICDWSRVVSIPFHGFFLFRAKGFKYFC